MVSELRSASLKSQRHVSESLRGGLHQSKTPAAPGSPGRPRSKGRRQRPRQGLPGGLWGGAGCPPAVSHAPARYSRDLPGARPSLDPSLNKPSHTPDPHSRPQPPATSSRLPARAWVSSELTGLSAPASPVSPGAASLPAETAAPHAGPARRNRAAARWPGPGAAGGPGPRAALKRSSRSGSRQAAGHALLRHPPLPPSHELSLPCSPETRRQRCWSAPGSPLAAAAG